MAPDCRPAQNERHRHGGAVGKRNVDVPAPATKGQAGCNDQAFLWNAAGVLYLAAVDKRRFAIDRFGQPRVRDVKPNPLGSVAFEMADPSCMKRRCSRASVDLGNGGIDAQIRKSDRLAPADYDRC